MSVHVIHGDCRTVLSGMEPESVHCVVTSPPYFGLRDYGVAGQIGLEATPDAYIAEMVAVFREVRRVLRKDGTVWLNLGDSYAGSGKGGNPEVGKQATNRGSQTIGCLYGTGRTAREAAVSNVTRKTWEIGAKPKDLLMIPARVALALQADGWWLRSEIIWHKPNPMPESVTDRPTSAHEKIYLLTKSDRYWYDADAVREKSTWVDEQGRPVDSWGRLIVLKIEGNGQTSCGGSGVPQRLGANVIDGKRNLRNVWTVATQPYSEAHFATFPPALIEPCIRAGCPEGGAVLDPFGGSGTTGLVADRLGRNAILIELNSEYVGMAYRRIQNDAPLFVDMGTG